MDLASRDDGAGDFGKLKIGDPVADVGTATDGKYDLAASRISGHKTLDAGCTSTVVCVNLGMRDERLIYHTYEKDATVTARLAITVLHAPPPHVISCPGELRPLQYVAAAY